MKRRPLRSISKCSLSPSLSRSIQSSPVFVLIPTNDYLTCQHWYQSTDGGPESPRSSCRPESRLSAAMNPQVSSRSLTAFGVKIVRVRKALHVRSSSGFGPRKTEATFLYADVRCAQALHRRPCRCRVHRGLEDRAIPTTA